MEIPGLTPDILLVLGIITFTIVLFVIEIVRVDVVACLVLVLLGLTKIVPAESLFSGFSSDAVIALIGIMIIGSGLERSGIVAKITQFILKFGGSSEFKIRFLLMSIGGLCSGFLRSVGTIALLLPVITRIRRSTGIAKPALLIPLSFCTILGSTWTLVGSGPLILINSLLENTHGLMDKHGKVTDHIGLFTVAPIGLVLLSIGIMYFIFFSKWILPKVAKRSSPYEGTMAYFKRIYGIGGGVFEVRVPPSSPLVNVTLRQWESLLPEEVVIVGIKQGSSIHFPPLRKTEVKAGAVIAILGSKEVCEGFVKKYSLKLSPYLTVFSEYINPAQAGLCEAVVPPSSSLIGTDFRDLHMRREFGIQVIAVHRGQNVSRGGKALGEINIRAGDTLGMFCDWRALSRLEKNPDFVVVTTDYPKDNVNAGKMGMALLFFIIAITLVVLGLTSVPVGLMLGAVGMIFSGVISIDDAYEAVSWKTVFLLAGLIPLGIAVQTSGTSDWLAGQFLAHIPQVPIWVLLLIIGALASMFSLVISNIGATVIMVPLAVELAKTVGGDPRAFALMVAIAASNSFLIPTHQANALISGPGRYKVMDFIKAGSFITIMYLIVTMLMISLLFN